MSFGGPAGQIAVMPRILVEEVNLRCRLLPHILPSLTITGISPAEIALGHINNNKGRGACRPRTKGKCYSIFTAWISALAPMPSVTGKETW